MLKAINLSQYYLVIIGVITCCLPSQVIAFSDVSLSHSIQTCSKLVNEEKRLSCFDQLVTLFVEPEESLVEQVEEVSVPSTIAVPPLVDKEEANITTAAKAHSDLSQAEIKKQKENAFGKEHLAKTLEEEAQEVNSIELTISKLKTLPRGEWKITFENGQVWNQKNNTRIKLKMGDRVIIEKGAMSAVYLKKVGSNKRIPVKRLK